MNKVCLVLGAGRGIGATVANTFSKEGYHAYLCRRSNQEGLDESIQLIKKQGGSASGQLLDATKENTIEELIKYIENDIGQIEVLIYNLGAQSGFKSLEETSLKEFEWGWKIASQGLFRSAKVICPLMAERGKGTIIATSATAAMRGNKNQHSHASAMGARRLLCQTLNDEFAKQGIHIAHVIVDGMVDAPDTLGKILGPELFKELRKTKGSKDGLVMPEKIAEAFLYLHNQHRSTWTHELDLRSFSDSSWWNSN